MKEIPLTRGKVALVDDEDYEHLSALTWHAYRNQGGGWYARSSTLYRKNGGKSIWMHRMILDCPAGKNPDHKDGNGLNNQRSNLREATQAQNMYNMGVRANSKSGFKGVSRYSGKGGYTGEWKAVIKHHRKTIYIGKFRDPIDAALAYDTKAAELFGEFARLNFPERHKHDGQR
jgi:hypothetical protein